MLSEAILTGRPVGMIPSGVPCAAKSAISCADLGSHSRPERTCRASGAISPKTDSSERSSYP
ncbi:hypothetical protein [Sphingomonas sediminicola]